MACEHCGQSHVRADITLGDERRARTTDTSLIHNVDPDELIHQLDTLDAALHARDQALDAWYNARQGERHTAEAALRQAVRSLRLARTRVLGG